MQLLGRVGTDPQKRGNDDNPVVTFSLATATSYKYTNLISLMHRCISLTKMCFISISLKRASGDLVQRTEWHKVVVFNPRLCEVVTAYLKKGHRTLVNGRITYNEINDREGRPKIVTSIVADDIVFLQSP